MVVLGLLWVPFIHLINNQLYLYLQSVQAYISPPIASCFILGIIWPRLNGKGAITSLLTGFVLGAVRFIMELKDRSAGGHYFTSGAASWLVNMNFLHYAILMFVVCSVVLIAVSLATPAPDRRQLAGLTFATVQEKLAVQPVGAVAAQPAYRLTAESAAEHRLNVAFSVVLALTVIGLWIYFR
jgi:SSS family solute:Na+ symporter